MRSTLFVIGTLLAAAAAILGVVSTDMTPQGVPESVHPIGALAVGVSALAFLYASKVSPNG